MVDSVPGQERAVAPFIFGPVGGLIAARVTVRGCDTREEGACLKGKSMHKSGEVGSDKSTADFE